MRRSGGWAPGAGNSWQFYYSGASIAPDALRVAGQINTGIVIPVDTVVRAQVAGLGTYTAGGVNLGYGQWRYTTDGSAVLTNSPVVPSANSFRKNNVSGVVDNISVSCVFKMPVTGVLRLGFTWDRSMYSDPWTLDVSI